MSARPVQVSGLSRKKDDRIKIASRPKRQAAGIITLSLALTLASCQSSNTPPPVAAFSLNVNTTAANPLVLVAGQPATLTFTADGSYVLNTWTMQVQYSPASPICALAVPSAPTSSALVFSLTTTGGATTAPPPCKESILFTAVPSDLVSASPLPTPPNIYTQTVFVSVLASPSPTPAPSPGT